MKEWVDELIEACRKDDEEAIHDVFDRMYKEQDRMFLRLYWFGGIVMATVILASILPVVITLVRSLF